MISLNSIVEETKNDLDRNIGLILIREQIIKFGLKFSISGNKFLVFPKFFKT